MAGEGQKIFTLQINFLSGNNESLREPDNR
jgi:hypothetical protein